MSSAPSRSRCFESGDFQLWRPLSRARSRCFESGDFQLQDLDPAYYWKDPGGTLPRTFTLVKLYCQEHNPINQLGEAARIILWSNLLQARGLLRNYPFDVIERTTTLCISNSKGDRILIITNNKLALESEKDVQGLIIIFSLHSHKCCTVTYYIKRMEAIWFMDIFTYWRVNNNSNILF